VLLEKIRAWRSRQRLTFVFDATKSTWHMVGEILGEARETGKEGAVAQRMVGAKLQLTYPQVAVENFSFNSSGAGQGRPGDFYVGDTAFHVTVSPMAGVYDRCRANLGAGHRAYLIVPDRSLVGARQNAEAASPGRIFVKSLEAFVGGGIDRMSTFGRTNTIHQFCELLETYNARVDAVEVDKSLMIQIPPNLATRR
jgi:hypothetical protein